MKKVRKVLLYLIILLTLFTLSGCKDKKDDKKSFTVTLESNASARRSWNYNLSDEGIVKILISSDKSHCEPDSYGCGTKILYKVTALKPGNVTLTFERKDRDYNDKIIYDIIVDDDLSISETHKTVREKVQDS